MTAIIRAVEPADLDGLLTLYAQSRPLDPGLSADVERQRLDALLRQPGLTVFGAFDSDRLLASCVLHVLPNLAKDTEAYALIENIVTDTAERRKGHSKGVVRAAGAAALAAGCDRIMLMTGPTRRYARLREMRLNAIPEQLPGTRGRMSFRPR